jgi:hypothetical protein
MTSTKWRWVSAIGLSAVLAGCASVGPEMVYRGSVAYNQAIVDSIDEQFLLNLVRLRYRDNPSFLQVDTITESLSISGLAEVAATATDGDVDGVGAGAEVAVSRSPTIVYRPVRGKSFLQAVLRPVSAESLLVLAQSGWSIQRLFGIAVERMNGLYNAPSASGPTPDYRPRFERFRRALELLRKLQTAKLIDLAQDAESGQVYFFLLDDASHAAQVAELRRLLGLGPTASRLALNTAEPSSEADRLDLRTRSIFGILFYLSHKVEVPPPHVERGLVTVTPGENGEPFAWSEVGGELLSVHHAAQRPVSAAVSVPYRGWWFYIADDDLNSKSTFILLVQLFNLLAGEAPAGGPTLTIPVGR